MAASILLIRTIFIPLIKVAIWYCRSLVASQLSKSEIIGNTTDFIVFYHKTVISYFLQRMPASWLVPTIGLSRHRYCGQREEGSSLKTQCRENATHLHLFIRDGRERFFSLGGAVLAKAKNLRGRQGTLCIYQLFEIICFSRGDLDNQP